MPKWTAELVIKASLMMVTLRLRPKLWAMPKRMNGQESGSKTNKTLFGCRTPASSFRASNTSAVSFSIPAAVAWKMSGKEIMNTKTMGIQFRFRCCPEAKTIETSIKTTATVGIVFNNPIDGRRKSLTRGNNPAKRPKRSPATKETP